MLLHPPLEPLNESVHSVACKSDYGDSVAVRAKEKPHIPCTYSKNAESPVRGGELFLEVGLGALPVAADIRRPQHFVVGTAFLVSPDTPLLFGTHGHDGALAFCAGTAALQIAVVPDPHVAVVPDGRGTCGGAVTVGYAALLSGTDVLGISIVRTVRVFVLVRTHGAVDGAAHIADLRVQGEAVFLFMWWCFYVIAALAVVLLISLFFVSSVMEVLLLTWW